MTTRSYSSPAAFKASTHPKVNTSENNLEKSEILSLPQLFKTIQRQIHYPADATTRNVYLIAQQSNLQSIFTGNFVNDKDQHLTQGLN